MKKGYFIVGRSNYLIRYFPIIDLRNRLKVINKFISAEIIEGKKVSFNTILFYLTLSFISLHTQIESIKEYLHSPFNRGHTFTNGNIQISNIVSKKSFHLAS